MYGLMVGLSFYLIVADFPICTFSGDQNYPCPIYENNQYYVFWTDYRYAPLRTLYGARISTGGTVIDPDGKHLCNGIDYDNCCAPRAAYDGTNFLVVCGCGGC